MNHRTVWFTIFLGWLAALPALSIDVSAPSMALLPQVLNTSELMAGLTISLFMAGFALGQFAGGSLSDRFGRKPLLRVGFLVYTLAGAACFAATSGLGLVAARFAQGTGAGICAVLSFAMVQDLFQGPEARAKRAYVSTILSGVPILAPAIGALVIGGFGWRAIYILLAAAGAVLLTITWFFHSETRKPPQAGAAPGLAGKGLTEPRFVQIALINSLSYGAVFTYIAGAPILVIDYYGRSTTSYAAIFACTAMALTLGAWSAARLGRRGVSAEALISRGLGVSVAAALLLLLACTLAPALSGPVAIVLLVAILFCRGVLAPNLQHLAIERQQHRAGAASAVVGIMQLSFGTLSSVAVALLLAKAGPVAVAGPMLFFAGAAALLWLWIA